MTEQPHAPTEAEAIQAEAEQAASRNHSLQTDNALLLARIDDLEEQAAELNRTLEYHQARADTLEFHLIRAHKHHQRIAAQLRDTNYAYDAAKSALSRPFRWLFATLLGRALRAQISQAETIHHHVQNYLNLHNQKDPFSPTMQATLRNGGKPPYNGAPSND